MLERLQGLEQLRSKQAISAQDYTLSETDRAISAASANLRLCFFSLALRPLLSSLLYLAYLIDKYGILYSAFMNR